MEPNETWLASVEPDLPPRSGLLNLTPIGVGTGQVESLTGYLARLADSHEVSVADLVCGVIAERLATEQQRIGQVRVKAPLYLLSPHTLLTATAEVLVPALESLTTVIGLANCTLSAKRLCTNEHMLKARRSWCPACFKIDAVKYDRLCWAVAEYTHCHIHKCELVSKCHVCGGNGTYSVRGRYSLGFCHRCGTAMSSMQTTETASEAEAFKARAIDNLLEFGQTNEALQDGLSLFQANLTSARKLFPGGGITPLSHHLGIPIATIVYLQRGRYRLAIKTLLKLCWCYEKMPTDFFATTINFEGIWPRSGRIEEFARKKRRTSVPADSIEVIHAILRLVARAPFNRISVRSVEFEARINQKHPSFQLPITRSLIRSVNSANTRVLRRYRLWRDVEQLKAIMRSLIEQGNALTLKRIGNRMGKGGRLIKPEIRHICFALLRQVKEGRLTAIQERKPPWDIAVMIKHTMNDTARSSPGPEGNK